MPTVYVESSVLSYLAALPSRDLLIAAHQQVTHDWWRNAPSRFDLFVSQLVLDEIRRGDSQVAQRRLELLGDVPVLKMNEEVRELTAVYAQRLGLTGRAVADLPHFAFSVAFSMDFLVTWNCSHIANGHVIRKLTSINADIGRVTPSIVTPEELLNDPIGEQS